MAVLISFVRFSFSLPFTGKVPTFLGVTLFALMPNDTHDMNLPATVVNGIAHGFAVDG